METVNPHVEAKYYKPLVEPVLQKTEGSKIYEPSAVYDEAVEKMRSGHFNKDDSRSISFMAYIKERDALQDFKSRVAKMRELHKSYLQSKDPEVLQQYQTVAAEVDALL